MDGLEEEGCPAMETLELQLRKSRCVQTVGEGQTPQEGGAVYARTLEPGRVGLEHTVVKPGDGPVLLFTFSAWAGQRSWVGRSAFTGRQFPSLRTKPAIEGMSADKLGLLWA